MQILLYSQINGEFFFFLIGHCTFHIAWIRSKSSEPQSSECLWAIETILISGLKSGLNSECKKLFL